MPKAKTNKSKKPSPDAKAESGKYDFAKLTRSSTNKILGGVCGGLAEFFDIDVSIVRLIFALLFVFGGSGVMLYLILWIILPSDKYGYGITEKNIRMNAEEIKDTANDFAQRFQGSAKKENSRKLFGMIVLFLGVAFLFSNFGFLSFHWIAKLWPILLIILAFSLLTNGRER